VEEAEEILEKRINAVRGRGEGYLNVIVGKGNHSTGGVRKIGPAVIELCRKRGLKVEEEAGNQGKLIVTLGEDGVGHGGGGGQGYGNQQQHQQQQQGPPNELGILAKTAAPKLIRKLQGCCIIC